MVNELSIEETTGLIAHELLHIVNNHLFQSERRPLNLEANVAEDYFINCVIRDEYQLELPKDGMFPEKEGFPLGKSSDWYYKEIVKARQSIRSKRASQESGGSNSSNELSDQEGKIEDLFNNLENSAMQHNRLDMSQLSDIEKDLVESQVKDNIINVAQEVEKSGGNSRGNLPGSVKDLLGNLFKLRIANVDWKKLYKRFMASHIDIHRKMTRKKESKRFSHNPGTRKTRKHKILYAVDTSGSMGKDDLTEAFTEVHHVWKAGALIDVVECDTEINQIYPYDGVTPKFVLGRGGTAIGPAIDYFNKHIKEYSCLVIVTDGYHERPKIKSVKPIIHLVTRTDFDKKDFSDLPYTTIIMDN